MALATLTQLKAHLSITDTSQDSLLQQLLDAATAAVRSYLDRPIEQATVTEYYSGTGQRDLVVKTRPVDLSNTAGISVYVDAGGLYGAGSGGFASNTLLTYGRDYCFIPDNSNSTLSQAGIVRRLGTGFTFDMVGRPYGSLATRYRYQVWPVGDGNIKVTYTGGYSTVPADITLAVLQLAAAVYRTRTTGGTYVTSDSLGEYREMLNALNGQGPLAEQVGSVQFLLRPYLALTI